MIAGPTSCDTNTGTPATTAGRHSRRMRAMRHAEAASTTPHSADAMAHSKRSRRSVDALPCDEAGALRSLQDAIRRAGGYSKARELMGILPGQERTAEITDPERAARQLLRDSLTGRSGQGKKGAAAGAAPALYWDAR